MGALQAYHWAALFPTRSTRIVVNCGVARTAVHNQVFLRSLMATLEAAPEHIGDGRFSAEPRAAKRAFGRIYAGWALSQDFYRAGLHLAARTRRARPRDLPAHRLGGPLRRAAPPPTCSAAPHLGCRRHQRQRAYGGDLPRALRAIKARVLLMPGETDLYFRVADNAAELPFLEHAATAADPQHLGPPRRQPAANPADAAFIKAAVRDLLDT